MIFQYLSLYHAAVKNKSQKQNMIGMSYFVPVFPPPTRGPVIKRIAHRYIHLIYMRIKTFYWNYNSSNSGFKIWDRINPCVLWEDKYDKYLLCWWRRMEETLVFHTQCQEIIVKCDVCMNTCVSLCVLLCMDVHRHALAGAQPCHWRQAACSLWRAFCWVGAHTKQLQTTAP